MKLRICFLVMSLSALVYYGFIQLAPAGRAATVSSQFHQLGKNALARIERAHDAENDEGEFSVRIGEADTALTIAQAASRSAADEAEFVRLVSYMQAVKQDHQLMQTASYAGDQPDHQQVNAARQTAENTFR